MNLHDLVSQIIIDSKGAADVVTADSSLRAFLPELVICVTVLALLLVRLFRVGRHVDMFWIAVAGSSHAVKLEPALRAVLEAGE